MHLIIHQLFSQCFDYKTKITEFYINLLKVFPNGLETDFDCCKMSEEEKHPLCMTFEIPENDPIYGPSGQRCHDFKRSVAGHRPNCALGSIQFHSLQSH